MASGGRRSAAAISSAASACPGLVPVDSKPGWCSRSREGKVLIIAARAASPAPEQHVEACSAAQPPASAHRDRTSRFDAQALG